MYWFGDPGCADSDAKRSLHRARTGRLRELLAARPERIAWLIAGMLWLVAVGAVLDRHFIGHTAGFFWDLPVYPAAVEILAEGGNPYDTAQLRAKGVDRFFLTFVMPPHVTRVLEVIGLLGLGGLVVPVLVLAHVAACIAIPLLLCRWLVARDRLSIAIAISSLLVTFEVAGLGAMGACNNSTALYALILLGLDRGLRGNWRLFDAAVLLAALFKPFFVTFWIIPVLLDGLAVAHLRRVAILTVCAALPYLASVAFDRSFSAMWLANLNHQFHALQIVGVNLYGWAFKSWPGAQQPLLLLVHAALVAAMLATVLLSGAPRPQRLAMLIVVAIFANPRPLCYDSAIAAIPILVLIAGAVPAAVPRHLVLAVTALGLTLLTTAITHKGMLLRDEMVFAPVALAALLLAARHARGAAGNGGAVPDDRSVLASWWSPPVNRSSPSMPDGVSAAAVTSGPAMTHCSSQHSA